jgi:hypothetical protein
MQCSLFKQCSNHHVFCKTAFYSYRTADGTSREEVGTPSRTGGTNSAGSYKYIGVDGRTYKVEFEADENGFRPRGTHLPVQPGRPVPENLRINGDFSVDAKQPLVRFAK